jgi:transcriptional regulator with XRE-family HTH domain
MRTGPAEYTDGLGETVRGFRLYIGLSRPAMADKLGIALRSYERIEDGRAACPPGFLDTLSKLVVTFDKQVDQLMITGLAEKRELSVPVSRDRGLAQEWTRCVAGRAAMMSAKIVPVLVR